MATVSRYDTGMSSGAAFGSQAGDFAIGGVGAESDALSKLIAQLGAGGTPQMQATTEARTAEVSNLEQQRAGYSKEAAFADAQGLIAQTMRQALEKLIPGINTGALGAGASQSSMRALLTQKAAENAAQASATEGIKAATQYGQVSGGISDVISRLLAIQDPSAQLLINALGTSKTGASAGGRTASAPVVQFAPPSSFGGGSQTPTTPQAPMAFGGGSTAPNVFGQFGPAAPDISKVPAQTPFGRLMEYEQLLQGSSPVYNPTF